MPYTLQSQQEDPGKPEINVDAPQQGGQADTTKGTAMAGYHPDIDYKSEASDPDIKAVNEEEDNSDAKYKKRSYLNMRHYVRGQ